MNANLTDITILMDRSGSMAGLAKDMAGGLDTFLDSQKDLPGECRVSFYQFNTEFEEVYVNRHISEVPKSKLIATGGTGLYNSLAAAINATGKRLREIPEDKRPGKVLFLVITDGYNTEWNGVTTAQAKEMITHQENKYNWQFIYLGANQDAFLVGGEMGLAAFKTSGYQASRAGVAQMYAGVNSAVSKFRGKSELLASCDFDAEDRAIIEGKK